MGRVEPMPGAVDQHGTASTAGGRGMTLDLRWLPPEPERLIGMVDLACRGGITHLFVEFGDTFPWSFDSRFRGPFSFPEQVVAALDERADRRGIALVPVLPQISSLEHILGIPAYAHLRLSPDCCDVPDPRQPGFRNIQEEMLDDIIALLPRTRMLLFGTVSEIPTESESSTSIRNCCEGAGTEYLASMIRHAHSAGLEVMIDGILAGFVNGKAAEPQAACIVVTECEPDAGPDAGDVHSWHVVPCDPLDPGTPALSFTEGNGILLVPQWNGPAATFDLIPAELLFLPASDLFGGKDLQPERKEDGGPVPEPADALVLTEFLAAIGAGWERVRMLREYIVSATLDPHRRSRIGIRSDREFDDMQDVVAEARRCGRGIVERYRGRIAEPPLRRAIAARIEPLHEELKLAEARLSPLFRY